MDPFFKVRDTGGQTVVEFTTESLMNPLELERIGHGLYDLVDTGGKSRLLVDFTRVRHLSSQAIGIILTLNKKLSTHKDRQLTLCGVGAPLLQLLKITRLDKILTIVPTQKDALAAKA